MDDSKLGSQLQQSAARLAEFGDREGASAITTALAELGMRGQKLAEATQSATRAEAARVNAERDLAEAKRELADTRVRVAALEAKHEEGK